MTIGEDNADEGWRHLRGFTSGGYCGEPADPLDAELHLVRSVPGLEPIWESEWDKGMERYWLRCPLASGHDGAHGTYLGSLPWRSRDFYYPGDTAVFDAESREWYLIWGPQQPDRRVIGPVSKCDVERPATGSVNGSWMCALWRQHPGNCKFHFVELVDIDLSPLADDTSDLGASRERDSWKDEFDRRVLGHFLSGDASLPELVEAFYRPFPEAARDLIATRTTGEERAEARRCRDRKRRAFRRALESLWEAEWARRQAATTDR